ncbi:44452_t:CDS:2 [Gigaspora margarita]|uniref:44452_t:CDS:1 n=1 Tax=Gigaspora margarita TaxID=4874 RepID=A0ABN7VB82_GIGMA|nr:44452_t:CDS:2 [Gigaspora margarita]
MFKETQKQICELVLYRCEKLSIDKAFKFTKDQLQSAFIPKHYDNIQEVQAHQYQQKKNRIWLTYGHFKKALNYSLKDNNKSSLEAKINAAIQLKKENILSENMNIDNMLKLSDRHIYNIDDINDPTKYQGKGKPASNHIKAYNENKKLNSSMLKRKKS